MRHFFCPALPIATGATVVLPAAESSHATKVLRLQAGDKLLLLNGKGIRAEAEILPAPDSGRRQHESRCRILSLEHCPEPKTAIHLYIAPPRGKNMDAILKTATELGVRLVTPIACRFGVAKPDSDKDSWNQTLIAACKQSGNPFLPAIHPPIALYEALKYSTLPGFFGAVPRVNDQALAHDSLATASSVTLWIGPEGGFAPEEDDALRAAGLTPLTVGPWILRVDTAVPALIGAILGILGR